MHPDHTSDTAAGSGRLGTAWERTTLCAAGIGAGATLAVAATLALALPTGLPPWAAVTGAAAVAAVVYAVMTRRIRRRRAILGEPFPGEWAAVLEREVVFFRTLEPVERERFRRELQVFLGEKRITGVGAELDETTRVLVAASAVIPIFGFPEWEWDQISEVLVYPSRFGRDYSTGDGHSILGMVGTGALNRMMILSQPDLLQGFRNAGDRRHVGIHEFAHLVDKSDGAIDGVPTLGLDRRAIGPWIELVRREMAAIRAGDSDIDPYALTNEAEFFAVATEYFFERPGVMRRKRPELYAALARVFRQGLADRASSFTREIRRGRPRIGRNSPCPCGSGEKFKRCCLRAARRRRGRPGPRRT